jgi:hypothetical protein
MWMEDDWCLTRVSQLKATSGGKSLILPGHRS